MTLLRGRGLLRGTAVLTLTAAVALTGCTGTTESADPSERSATAAEASASPTPETHEVTVSAMGDMLPHMLVNSEARTDTGYDYGHYFSAIKPVYQSSDIVFCNQEVLSSATSASQITTYPQFRAPVQFAESLSRDVGCNAINLANNHMADYEQSDIDLTRTTWDGLDPLLISGANRSQAEQDAVSYAEVNGITVAQLSYTVDSNQLHTTYGLNRTEGDLIDRQLAEARANADAVMVSMHWGTEDSTGINETQRQLTEKLVAAGVDVVIGTGPHVLEPVQWFDRPDGGRTLVWNSIGNMLSTQVPANNRVGGVAQWSFVQTGDDAVEVQDASFTPTFMDFVSVGQTLTTRHDLNILPLADADAAVRREFSGRSADERYQFVTDTLGDAVTVVR